QMVKDLRERTGAGVMDAKRALEASDGDMKKAAAIIEEQGLKRAEKKEGRGTSEGLVWSYIHGGTPGQTGGRVGALVEINCETDFVARTDDFRALCRDVAMQVAAMDPKYITAADIPQAELREQAGNAEKYAERVALLSQPFIRDASKTISDLVRERIGKLGENIVVRRFARFELGAAPDIAEE
ncbi:MAG TPA: elongation factor Ts, partial [Thermomicrobiaceae bacterium]|nr:elongation factor Ts [Thermomicrobiaceae bacterium]